MSKRMMGQLIVLCVIILTFYSCGRRNYCYGEWNNRPKGWKWATK